MRGLERLGKRVMARLDRVEPWTNVYGLARTLLAVGTLLTLLFNDTGILFRPAAGLPDPVSCSGAAQLSLYCLVPATHLELGRYLSVLVLLVVAVGWRPRWTALPHWWVAFSLQASGRLVDGGEQVTALLTPLLLPLALTDPRPWHWGALPAPGRPGLYSRLLAYAALVALRVQVAGIYLHAAVGKVGVPEWRDGTALYYWLTSPYVGATDF